MGYFAIFSFLNERIRFVFYILKPTFYILNLITFQFS